MDIILSPKKLIKMTRTLQKIPVIGRRKISYPRAGVVGSNNMNNVRRRVGISSNAPIVLPCDSLLMNYIVSLVKLGMSSDLEKALLNSIIRVCCSTSFHLEQTSQQLLLCGH
ncbi:hypothetical protein M0R45_031199 [Rubus argutus]|uniref:Uncharacterized protein n=1 Tax=Rubus argutus TaxID=59490 RepID=A0AAW1WDZ0_RUBAR